MLAKGEVAVHRRHHGTAWQTLLIVRTVDVDVVSTTPSTEPGRLKLKRYALTPPTVSLLEESMEIKT